MEQKRFEYEAARCCTRRDTLRWFGTSIAAIAGKAIVTDQASAEPNPTNAKPRAAHLPTDGLTQSAQIPKAAGLILAVAVALVGGLIRDQKHDPEL